MSIPIHDQLSGSLNARDSLAMKTALQALPREQKGLAFESLLAELYRGNGWLVQVQGGRGDAGADILLFHPKTPTRISLIVQAKNHALPLTFDQTRLELVKFEEKALERYGCQNFRLVSVSGFVQEAGKLGDFNMLLDGWEHVAELIGRYDPDHKAEPQIELFAHNRTTYELINKLWAESYRVAVIQATGTGKSFLIAKVLADFIDKRKIVLAPSHYILEQQRSKIPWLSESTDYMTYAKIGRMSEEEIAELRYDLIVLDEFHRVGAEVWGAAVQKLLDCHPEIKVLGTSATPIRYLDGERDMSDELFDEVAVDLSLAEAIARRILPAPAYISALYTLDEEIESLLAEVEASKRTDEEKAGYREEIKQIKLDWEKTSGVPEILKKHLPPGIDKIIVFCRDQKHLDEMEIEVQRWFLKAGTHVKRKTYRILSADPESKDNLEVFKRAGGKDTVHLLFAIDMLNEGLHIPEVGAVILLRPTESPVIFYQQIGRCIEVGKEHVPVIFDLVNNFRGIRASDFLGDIAEATELEGQRRASCELQENSPVIQVEELSKRIEDVFDEIRNRLVDWEIMYDALVEYKKKHGDCNVVRGDKNYEMLGFWVANQRSFRRRGILSQKKIILLDELSFDWSRLDSKWDVMFNELLEYKIRYGTFVFSSDKIEYEYLKIWATAQRNKRYTMPSSRRTRLDEIGFPWAPRDDQWENMFCELCDYRDKHGDCNVPNNYKDNLKLAKWVGKQRSRKGELSEDRIRRLDEIDFDWDPSASVWMSMYKELCEYRDNHGHCNVPSGCKKNPKLSRWVNTQRTNKKNMPPNRVSLLDQVGFDWNPNLNIWEKRFSELCEYKKRFGDCNVPAKYEENLALGAFVIRLRYIKRKTIKDLKDGVQLSNRSITENQLSRLNKIGFDWDPVETQWLNNYMNLVKYKEKYGTCNVKIEFDKELYRWVSKQRSRKNELTCEKRQKLDGLGFDWNPPRGSRAKMSNKFVP